jgi:hypothetical protein
MAGGRKYTYAQVSFVLRRIIRSVPSREIIEAYRKKYYPGFGPPQLKYIKSFYGNHPDFG